MASTLRELGAQPVAQYAVPVRGTWNSLAVQAIPTDALYTSHNVFIRRGKLRNRPGLTLLNATVFDNPILGAAMVVTPLDKRILALSATQTYELGEHDTTWQATSSLTYSVQVPIDIALLETRNLYVALIAQEGHVLGQWDAVSHATTPVVVTAQFLTDPGVFDGPRGSTPLAENVFDASVFDTLDTYTEVEIPGPKAKSICIAGRRVIYLIPPHTVGWSAVFDHTRYPVNAFTKLAQSGDMGICVRPLGTLSFVVYKERSIYTARAQSGLDEVAFSFSEPISVEGPAGVHAVVMVGGAHMYMTRNGRVFTFDGARYPQPIADGVWLYLQEDIDPEYAHLIHGTFDYRLHVITFFYPRRGDHGRLHGMVLINIPLAGTDIEGQGVSIPASFLGRSTKPCTKGCEMRFERRIDRSLLFSADATNNQSFIFDEDGQTDDGLPYQCSMQTAMAPMPGAVQTQVTVETFVERAEGNGSLIIEAVTNDALENEGGTILQGNEQYLDLEKNPVQEHIAFNIPTRFFGMRYTWESSSTVRYAGAVVHGRGIGR